MGQFKPMVKMETTEPSVELKLKKGGKVAKKADGGMMGSPMSAAGSMPPAMPARGGMPGGASPMKPSLAMRRRAMRGLRPGAGPAGPVGGAAQMQSAMPPAMPAAPAMKKGGETKATHKAEMSKMKGLEKELKSHESKPASKGHKGLKTGGVVNGQGGFKKGGKVKMAMGGMMDGDMMDSTGGVVDGQGGYAKGGIINTEGQGGEYRNTKMHTAKADHSPAKTGGVKDGNGGGYATGGVAKANGGGYKKGGAPKKAYAAGGTVDSGRPVAMPQGRKPVPKPVAINELAGTYKKGGKVTPAEGRLQKMFASENAPALRAAKKDTNLKYGPASMMKLKDGGNVDLSKGAYDKAIGPSEEDMDMAKTIRGIPGKLFRGAKSLMGMDKAPKSESVTKTKESVTVTPAKKRGGSVKC
jgi:hypothetical protein